MKSQAQEAAAGAAARMHAILSSRCPEPAEVKQILQDEFEAFEVLVRIAKPIPMRLPCPDCGELHIDEGQFAAKPHHTHACQFCGNVWRPAVVETVGVKFLPGFKNEEE